MPPDQAAKKTHNNNKKKKIILLSPHKDTLKWVKYKAFPEPGKWETEGKSLKVCCDRQSALAIDTARLLPHSALFLAQGGFLTEAVPWLTAEGAIYHNYV